MQKASVRRGLFAQPFLPKAFEFCIQAGRLPWPDWLAKLGSCFTAAAAFHLAWSNPKATAFILVYAWGLIRLAAGSTAAQAFRFGFLCGYLVFAPHLFWFTNIFGWAAVCLWAILAFLTGLFVALLRCWHARFPRTASWLATPILWIGIEFFRSELYFLKFSWFTAGSVFSGNLGWAPLGMVGVYGIGFLVFLLASLTARLNLTTKGALLCCALLLTNWTPAPRQGPIDRTVKVAGIQLEFPLDLEVPGHLDRVLRQHPDAEILVLSEYSFDGPIPVRVREWCKRNGKFLIAGGKEDVTQGERVGFRNTAFVVGPDGEVIFRQCKSVPIQFFQDGFPAEHQRVWHSPWGAIAIPTCYDLSYRQVTDRFVEAGAEAFIVPFMDVEDWGREQHLQHARVAPMRAREYGVSIFRVGSSGISQHVSSSGEVLAEAGFPGQGEIIAGTLAFSRASLPLDHWFAPPCSLVVVIFILALLFQSLRLVQQKGGKISRLLKVSISRN
jgi:apolipoprotein N-acyltransferase